MFFDGGEFWGRDPKYGLEQSPGGLRLVKIGLMSHFEAVFFDMETGNQKTLALARKYPKRFLPIAVINPFHYEVGSGYLASLKRQGFRGFSFLSHYQYWKLNQYVVSALTSEFSRLGLPVQIGVASVEELALAVQVFKESRVPVLIRWVRGGGYNVLADEIAIAKNHPHFFFDVGNLVSLYSIRHLAEAIGSERLYFGTNAPLVYDSSTRLLVAQAGLSREDYENITYKTLSKVFGLSKKALPAGSGLFTKEELAVVDAHLRRPKIDPHWHLGGWDVIEPGKNFASFKKIIDECHYEAVVVSSILALNYDLQAGNRNVESLLKKDKRIYGYIVVDPMRVKDSLAGIEKYVKNKRFVGLKTIQDYYKIGLDDPRYREILKAAERHQLPVLAHRAGLAKAAATHPKIFFIAAHCTFENFTEFINVPNVTLDISASYAHRGETNLAGIVERVGKERVLYSSDGPLIAPYWTIGKIVGSAFDEATLSCLYYENARRIFTRLARKA